MENKPKDIEGLFDELQGLASSNHERRNELIKKLMVAFSETDFDPSKLRASDLESRLGMVSTIDSLMKSQEAVQINNLKLNLQKEKDEEASDFSAKAIELLREIAPNAVLPKSAGDKDINDDDIDDKIRERVKSEGVEISDGEKEEVPIV